MARLRRTERFESIEIGVPHGHAIDRTVETQEGAKRYKQIIAEPYYKKKKGEKKIVERRLTEFQFLWK